MKKIFLMLILVFIVPSFLWSQELQIGTSAQDTILNVTNSGHLISWSRWSKNITLTNYDADNEVYVTWDGSVPTTTLAEGGQSYILPESFEKIKWIRRKSIYLKCASGEEAFVGVEVDF
jgi:hypothetical protein